jgi:hypothetical protein
MASGLSVSRGQWLVGLGLILATGLLHLVEAPEYYGEVKYIGALFVASGAPRHPLLDRCLRQLDQEGRSRVTQLTRRRKANGTGACWESGTA